MSVRVRFAPNPSGELHVGSARAAMFNWLFARNSGGTFILRIEDTDPATAKPEFIKPILDALRWLGLDWDEGPEAGGDAGPYFQSQRRDLHLATLAKVMEAGSAYRCWCTPDEVKARGTPRGYDRHCRDLPESERARLEAEGHPFAVRFRVPDHPSVFTDLIRGQVSVEPGDMQDFVLARSDGSPTFVLANASDDIAMRITHAVRGEDLLSAANQTVLIYEALGAEPPIYAHLPLILDSDRRKLSKRRAPTGIAHYRQEGYLSEALVNCLALLGWSSPTLDEILSRERLVGEFTLDRVQPHGAIFDRQKLDWMNQEYIKALSPGELRSRVLELHPDTNQEALAAAIEHDLIQTRVVRLSEVPQAISYLSARPSIDPNAWDQFMSEGRADATLEAAAAKLESLEPWTVHAIKEAIQSLVADLGLHKRKGPQPIRIAISGTTVSLPLFESIYIIGRAESVARLRAAREVSVSPAG